VKSAKPTELIFLDFGCSIAVTGKGKGNWPLKETKPADAGAYGWMRHGRAGVKPRPFCFRLAPLPVV